MDKHRQFAHLTKYFDIPIARKDTARLYNVRWLLANIRACNAHQASIDESIGLLIMISRQLRVERVE